MFAMPKGVEEAASGDRLTLVTTDADGGFGNAL